MENLWKFVEIKAFRKIITWLLFKSYIQFICKSKSLFLKIILISNFTPDPFDELKLTPERYNGSQSFSFTSQE